MYSLPILAIKYVSYQLSALNSKGHGTHSPFIYKFIQEVLNDNRTFNAYKEIEALRKDLLLDDRTLTVTDLGAGSYKNNHHKRTIASIAKTATKPKKYAQLLFRIVHFYKPSVILELGTSLGITTCYLASANTNATVITIEGSAQIAEVAQENIKGLQIENVELLQHNFDASLPEVLAIVETIDFAFIDGNHTYLATKKYFEKILEKSNENTIIILDDIHWSKEMEQAWNFVKNHSKTMATIDLFYIGIVFLNTDFNSKQHFTIRY